MGKYVLATSGELYHWGIKGMKWGVRRYQRRDGTLTPAGKKRVAARAGRYLNPESEGTTERQAVAKRYRDRVTPGDDLDRAEGYLYSYANATLRDLGLAESPRARAYIEDIFRSDPLMKELSASRDAADAKREKVAITELSKMSDDDKKLATSIVKKFGIDEWGHYTSNITRNIGDCEDVRIEIDTRKGLETSSALAAVNFLKKYDLSKAREGVAKEYYDNPWSWVSDPNSDNYYTRDNFKRKIELSSIRIDPTWNMYETWWDDGDTYGGHAFIDEGSLVDMKVRSRSLMG